MKHGTTRLLRKLGIYALKCIVLVASVLIIAFALYTTHLLPCIPTQRIKVEDQKLWVCVANTKIEQMRGLSYSHYLPRNWAMLFVFDDYSHHGFWMKDMSYSIDILWLDDNYRPTEVARNAAPESYPSVFTPVYANRFVLETKPGVVVGNFSEVKGVNN